MKKKWKSCFMVILAVILACIHVFLFRNGLVNVYAESQASIREFKTDQTSMALLGDVNGDGNINLKDARLILRTVLGIVVDNESINLSVADLDKDDTLTLVDVQLSLKAALGIIKLNNEPIKLIDSNGKEYRYSENSSYAIYALDDGWSEYLSMPEDAVRSFRLVVESSDYKIMDSKNLTIKEDGTIEPKIETWYWNGNVGSTVSSGEEGERVTQEISFGEFTMNIQVDGKNYPLHINVVNYASYYARQVMDSYIYNNITDGMSDYDKMEKICEFAAGYNYDAGYSGYTGLIVAGGGDCWASTSAMQYMCDKIGLKNHVRYAAKDPGAGSGHRNLAVLLDGEMYMADAGFVGEAPRYYSISKLLDGFSYYITSGAIVITQYDGYDENLMIPSQLGEYAVKTIGKNAFTYLPDKTSIKTLTISEGIQTLEEGALANLQGINQITLPASLSEIGEFAFCRCANLKEIHVNNSESFCEVDGVLFDKGQTVLRAFPNGRSGSYSIPNNTKKIGDYAFYYSDEIKEITVSEGCEELGSAALAHCSKLEKVTLPTSLKKIGDFAFRDNYSLSSIYIPESVEEIGESVFESQIVLKGAAGSYVEQYAKAHGLTFEAQ